MLLRKRGSAGIPANVLVILIIVILVVSFLIWKVISITSMQP